MLNFAEDDPQNNLDDIRSFTEHLGDHLNPVPADASYFPFPPTFFCPESLHDLLLFPSSSAEAIINSTGTALLAPPDGLQPAPVLHPPHGATPAMVAPTADVSSARTGASRKDRHSKIFTASGPRDRRMRLSIDVARKFFQLQDMLGFDKASKTVQWLLSMSKAAIKDLAAGSSSKRNDNSTSSSNLSPNSESSTISGSKNYCNKNSSSTVTAAEAGEVHMAAATTTTKARKGSSTAHKVASRRVEYFNSTLARDSRVKARERARERTKEKQRFTSLTSSNNSNPLDAIKEESTALPLQDLKSILDQFVERANCDYPSSGGTATIPVYGNISHQGDTAAVGGTTSSIYQEQWDLETISFYNYSR